MRVEGMQLLSLERIRTDERTNGDARGGSGFLRADKDRPRLDCLKPGQDGDR